MLLRHVSASENSILGEYNFTKKYSRRVQFHKEVLSESTISQRSTLGEYNFTKKYSRRVQFHKEVLSESTISQRSTLGEYNFTKKYSRRVQFHKEVRVVKIESSLVNGKWYILSNLIILSIGDANKG
jgi:hypothetical protein